MERLPRVLVGLGNRGPLARTRHSVGRLAATRVAELCGERFTRDRGFRADVAVCGGGRVTVAMPRDPMNMNGRAVARLLSGLGADARDDLLVLHDDMELPLGQYRIVRGTSAKGNRGVESCFSAVGHRDFWRVRMGIGRPPSSGSAAVIEHVLRPFDDSEADALAGMLDAVARHILALGEAGRRGAGPGGDSDGVGSVDGDAGDAPAPAGPTGSVAAARGGIGADASIPLRAVVSARA